MFIFGKRRGQALCVIALLALFYTGSSLAESILQVLPTRAVLADGKRSMTITLINRGDEDGNYRMFFRNIRANDVGEFSEVDTPIAGELFADKMVRFSPRRITVPARSKQSIRVVLRKPAELAAGEYRSHLVFRKLPKQNSVLDESSEANSVGFSLRPIVEVTIPVIVRHGELNATMNLANAQINRSDDGRSLSFTILREGSRSLYGDVDVWLLNDNGDKQNIGMARGVAVYSPNKKRVFNLPLASPVGLPDNGRLLLQFKEDPAYGGNLDARLETAL